MNTLTDLLLGVGQPRVSHFPDLCTLLYTYLSTLDYWTKIVYYLFTQTSPVAHTSALTPTYIKSQKLPNWPISKELGLGRMLLPHWKLLLITSCQVRIVKKLQYSNGNVLCRNVVESAMSLLMAKSWFGKEGILQIWRYVEKTVHWKNYVHGFCCVL